MLYQNFLTAHFPNCNWKGKQQQQQLLETLDGNDYDSINEITPVLSKTALTPTPSPVSQTKTPRRVPPNPPTQKSSSLDDQTSRRTPPPLPARTVSEGGARKDGTRAQVDDQQLTLPPRPPPRSDSSPSCLMFAGTRGQKGGQQLSSPPRPPPRLNKSPSASPPSTPPLSSLRDARAQKGGHQLPLPPRPPPRLDKSPSSPDRARAVSAGKPGMVFDSDDEDLEEYSSSEEYVQFDNGDDGYVGALGLSAPISIQKDRERSPGEKTACSSQKPEKYEEKKDLKKAFEEEKKGAKKVLKGKKKGSKKTDKQEQKGELKHLRRMAGQKTASVKPTLQVQPMSTPMSPTGRPPMLPPVNLSSEESDDDNYDRPMTHGLPLQTMTCKQLCARLRVCGMSSLADVCANELLDGDFFCELSEEQLRKPPFCLTDFDINPKLKRVKSGWIPK
ncbi:uncharacterized protein LOC143280596 isoform X2 [Babylonia areolata]|uniref:uncharacterized protein LOC143280596 isoform X2 n=1 Tax=Babylonia areolata TaxID=304850 RepID=UPI003FCEF6D7